MNDVLVEIIRWVGVCAALWVLRRPFSVTVNSHCYCDSGDAGDDGDPDELEDEILSPERPAEDATARMN